MDVRAQMERIYGELPLDEIPWNLEGPPLGLAALVHSGRVAPCRAVDLGCGAGNYAVWLARHRVIMPVSGIHQGTLEALRYARLLSSDVTAVHVSFDPLETEKVQKKWVTWGQGTRLIILDSPFRLLIEPLLQYIEEIIEHRQPNESITIVVPKFIPSQRWHNVLHMQTANVLRSELLNTNGVVVTDVPYHVHEGHEGYKE